MAVKRLSPNHSMTEKITSKENEVLAMFKTFAHGILSVNEQKEDTKNNIFRATLIVMNKEVRKRVIYTE